MKLYVRANLVRVHLRTSGVGVVICLKFVHKIHYEQPK